MVNDVFYEVTAAGFVEDGEEFGEVEAELVLVGKFHEGGVGVRPLVEESFTGLVADRELEPRFVHVSVSTEDCRKSVVGTKPHLIAKFFSSLLSLDTAPTSDVGEERFAEFAENKPDEEGGDSSAEGDELKQAKFSYRTGTSQYAYLIALCAKEFSRSFTGVIFTAEQRYSAQVIETLKLIVPHFRNIKELYLDSDAICGNMEVMKFMNEHLVTKRLVSIMLWNSARITQEIVKAFLAEDLSTLSKRRSSRFQNLGTISFSHCPQIDEKCVRMLLEMKQEKHLSEMSLVQVLHPNETQEDQFKKIDAEIAALPEHERYRKYPGFMYKSMF